MGTTQILGIVLGITLVSPQLLNAYSVASTAAADIPFWDFGFAQVQMIGYQAQVIPAMLAGFMLAYLEIFFRKLYPSVDLNDLCSIVFIVTNCFSCSRYFRSYRLDSRKLDFNYRKYRVDVFYQLVI